MKNDFLISIVSPVYQAEKLVEELVSRISHEMAAHHHEYEIILVDDGSSDNSWEIIQRTCASNPKTKGIKLSRNFGQHYAVTAGLEAASGDVIVIMDCDLQDDPKYIHELLQSHQSGFEIVFTKRIGRKHSFLKAINAKLYNLLFSLFSERLYDVDAGSLVMFSKRVKGIFLTLEDKDRLYIQMLKWVGFKSTYVSVKHHERFAGKSTYDFFKLMKLALQGWTSHSDKLLRFSIYSGFALSGITFVIGILIIIRYFIQGFQPGWPSLFIAIMFSTGLILMSIGIAGIYIGKIFEQTKNRPLFIIDKKINLP
jgi:glycosyltransferase involved in cell wall biosynthesis